MKKNLFVFALLAILAMSLSACNNKASEQGWIWYNPTTIGDEKLTWTLFSQCGGAVLVNEKGEKSILIDGKAYACPAGSEAASAPVVEALPVDLKPAFNVADCNPKGTTFGGPLNVEKSVANGFCAYDAPAEVAKPEATVVAPKETDGKSTVFLDACNSVGKPNVTNLVENGQKVENAFVFLDKNEADVKADDLHNVSVPAGVYGQGFYPVTGATFQFRGPGNFRFGRATVWCGDISTINSGMYVQINAQKLSIGQIELVGNWVAIPPVEQQPK